MSASEREGGWVGVRALQCSSVVEVGGGCVCVSVPFDRFRCGKSLLQRPEVRASTFCVKL